MTFVLPSIGGGIIASPTSAPAAFSNSCSVAFDGTDDKMQAGDSSTIASASVFTISAWARFHGTGQIFLASGTANQDRIYMELNNTEVGVVVKNGAGGAARWTTSLSANTWYHIACTVDSGTSKLFVNGVYRATNTSIATLSATAGDDLSIGTDNGNGMTSWAFDGDVDEVAIFNTALSDGGGLSIGDTAGGDIATLYNSGTPGDLSSFNPTSWWRMGDIAGGTGTTITDQGSEGNDGTLVNGPTFSTNVPTFNTYSVDLDGTNDYMAVTPSSSIDLYGFSAWFKSDNVISASSGVKGVLLGQGGLSYFLALGGNITGDFTNELITIRQSAQNSFAYTSASATIDTNWHHIAAAWSTSSATTGGDGYDIYLDGVKVGNAGGTSTPSSPYTLSSAFTIGMRQNGAYFFNGLIDEVAIFNSTLSASDIATLYNSGVPADITSLSPVGWWRMGDNNSGSGTTITDQGSGGNDGTLTNGPTFSTTVPS